MKGNHVAAVAALLLLAATLPFQASGAPLISIEGPRTGAMLLSRSVSVNGTAQGSSVDWQEALHDDFDLGTIDNLTNDATGTLFLNRTMYDTFGGASVDPSRWTVASANGPAASVGGGKLLLTGTGTADGWSSQVRLVSTAAVSDRINGTLEQFNELGTGACSVLGFYQDDNNYITVGRGFDFYGMGPGQRVVLVSSVSGCFTMESLGAANNAAHLFVITYDGTNAVAYMDGAQVATRAITLTGARCIIRTAVNASGDFVNSVWDDVSCLFLASGEFRSAVYDTLSESPDVTSVAWTANIPSGSSLLVSLRSADNLQLTGASGWLQVTNGQSAGFPAFQQYLQYKVLFGSPSGNSTAQFRDITVRYNCGVRTVDVSIDNRTTWTRASGKEVWNITLDIPDGPCYIWARITDVTGELQIASVVIDIDSSAPTASLSINDGAALTPRSLVNLTLAAQDAYGLASMMVSEDESFSGAQWQPFAGHLEWTLSAGEGPRTVYAKVMDKNGWESPVASATITVDTRPPAGTIRINAGGNYTRRAAVTLYLDASDASGVSEMLLSNRAEFPLDDWVPYLPVYSWNLLPGNGERAVHAKFRDPAGHVSVPVSASITLDSVLPEFSFTIDNSSAWTRSYSVELQLNASDNNAVGDMQISTSSQFPGAAWEPWTSVRQWVITTGEGSANLYARVRDAAENEAPAKTASIMVDTVAPLCVVSSLPATVASTSFSVGWNGNDETSGIVGYDVQFREGAGAWTDWKLLVNSTTAVFTGQDGLSYSFRARGHDLAGNVGAYPDNPKTTTTVRLQGPGSLLPVVRILSPMSSAPYTGKVSFTGTAKVQTAGRSIVSVQWQVDSGAWLNAAGTENWSFEWNTVGISKGTHTLRVRSYDGQNYSELAERTVSVDNPTATGGGGGPDLMLLLAALVVVMVAGALAGVFVMKRKRSASKATPAETASATAAAERAPGARALAPARPEPGNVLAEPEAGDAESGSEPGGEPPEAAPVSADAVDGEAAAPAGEAAPAPGAALAASADGEPAAAGAASALAPLNPTAYSLTEIDKHLDPARILPVVQAVFPGIPGELRFMPPEDITELVVTGERSKTRAGESLVLIMGRWYFGDEAKPTFLQRYNW